MKQYIRHLIINYDYTSSQDTFYSLSHQPLTQIRLTHSALFMELALARNQYQLCLYYMT